MSKERFEDMVRKLDDIDHVFFVTEQTVEVSREVYFWLEEQSKRVRELEELIVAYQSELSIKDNVNKRIKKKNKRYREAIERALGESGWGDEGNALYRAIGILTKALEESE